MNTLEQRWSSMIAELRSTPGVDVVRAERAAPVPGRAKEAARVLRLPHTPDLEAYAAFTDALHLEWRVDGSVGGSIDMPPLLELAKPENWHAAMDCLDGPLRAYGVSCDPARELVVPFDFWSYEPDAHVDIAAFLPREHALDVFVSEDHVACCEDAALLSFGEYLDLLLRSYGSPHARAALRMGSANERAIRVRDVFPGLLTRKYDLGDLIALTRSPDHNLGKIYAFFR